MIIHFDIFCSVYMSLSTLVFHLQNTKECSSALER